MRIYFLLFILLPVAGYAQSERVPRKWKKVFEEKELNKTYQIKEYMFGAYWDFDFTGDGVTDVALLVVERSTNKKGILMIDGKTTEYTLFGAGAKFGDGLDDFKAADRWGVTAQKDFDEPALDPKTGKYKKGKIIPIKYNAVIIDDYEDDAPYPTKGLIYWDGGKFVWVFQGF